MQRSVVAVTRRPECLHVTTEFVRVIAPLYFAYGTEVVEVACLECRSWPAPGKTAPVLSVAGTEIQSHPFPSANLFQDIPLFSTFGSLSVALWLLWELVLTGQQILVLGPTPDRCSKAVLGLCSLISPIPLAVDFRPFFTMFDQDFAAVSNPNNKAPLIIGGTNPFLLRSLEHFPNVVSLGTQRAEKDEINVARRNQTLRSLLRNRRWEKSIVLTKEESLVQRDTALISSLRRIGTDPKLTITENNERLRRAFRDLTSQFVQPLRSFLRMKPIGERAANGGLKVSAYHDDILREEYSFSKDSFLQYLLQVQGNRSKAVFPLELYRRFMSGPNFAPWLEAERHSISVERSQIVRTLIVETDVESLIAHSSRVGEELYARVATALHAEMAKPDRDVELCARMDEHLRALTAGSSRSEEPTH